MYKWIESKVLEFLVIDIRRIFCHHRVTIEVTQRQPNSMDVWAPSARPKFNSIAIWKASFNSLKGVLLLTHATNWGKCHLHLKFLNDYGSLYSNRRKRLLNVPAAVSVKAFISPFLLNLLAYLLMTEVHFIFILRTRSRTITHTHTPLEHQQQSNTHFNVLAFFKLLSFFFCNQNKKYFQHFVKMIEMRWNQIRMREDDGGAEAGEVDGAAGEE